MMYPHPRFVSVLLTVVGLGTAAPVSADIGRLFFSPAERAALDRARREADAPPVAESSAPQTESVPQMMEPSAPIVRPAITIDGYVRRSDGSETLWVNGENSYDGDLASSNIKPLSATVRGHKVRLIPLEEDTVILLKPGESYDPNTGTTVDIYEPPFAASGPQSN